MKIKGCLKILVIVLTSTWASAQCHHESTFGQKGHITNALGERCAYSQSCEETNPHFMTPALKHTTSHELRTIIFDNPSCMEELEGVNKEIINRQITGWYTGTFVLRDARFDTSHLRSPGRSQSRGKCIQSREYPGKGIAVEYFTRYGSTTKVVHMMGLRGCR